MIVRYDPSYKDVWDLMVGNSINGTFILKRDYMDYHKDRFQDHSLIIYTKDKGYPLAVFPANQHNGIIESHEGLTYGGLIWSDLKQVQVCRIIKEICDYYKDFGIKNIIYKTIPRIYHKKPADADLFALTDIGARLYRRDATTVIDPSTNFPKPKSKQTELTIKEIPIWDKFWPILEENLITKYNRKPVHSVQEIKLLASKFPNIKLYTSFYEDKLVGGVVVYITDTVVHSQYSAQSELGRTLYAMENLYTHIIDRAEYLNRYIDFGVSTEWVDGKSILNAGLLRFKEKFGGTTVVHDHYSINLGG